MSKIVTSKLSLILMKDDGEARSIRISKRGLLLLIILTILSPVTGFIGLWVGWEAWKSVGVWQQEKLAYQIQVDELRVQLERFSTLEALLKRQDAALGSKAGVHGGSSAVSPNKNAPAASKPEKAPTIPSHAVKGAATEEQQDKKKKVELSGSNSVPVQDENAVDSNKDFSTVDHGVIKIDKVSTEIKGKKIYIRVGLFTTEKVSQISGHVQFVLVTGTGEKYALMGSDTNFRIARFKNVSIDALLPVPSAVAAKSTILVEVVSGDAVVYRKSYPVVMK